MYEIIYSKEFSRQSAREKMKKGKKPAGAPESVEKASAMRRRVLEETGFWDIRGRREGQIMFIDTAIQLCKDNWLPLEIHQTQFELKAIINLCWDACPDARLNELIGMSDCIQISRGEGGWDVMLVILYNIVAFTKDEKLFFPDLLVQPYVEFKSEIPPPPPLF